MLRSSRHLPCEPRLQVNCGVSKIILSTFLCGVKVSLLFNIRWSSVGGPSLLAVPEVTVRSVAPISAAFAFAVFRVKRAVKPSEEAGGSQHYLQVFLSCPHEHARSSFRVIFLCLTANACGSDGTITTSLRRHVGLVGELKSRVNSHVSRSLTSQDGERSI